MIELHVYMYELITIEGVRSWKQYLSTIKHTIENSVSAGDIKIYVAWLDVEGKGSRSSYK